MKHPEYGKLSQEALQRSVRDVDARDVAEIVVANEKDAARVGDLIGPPGTTMPVGAFTRVEGRRTTIRVDASIKPGTWEIGSAP